MTNLKSKIALAGLTTAALIVAVFEGTRLEPYRDPVGIWTDCTGHTGRDVIPGKTNTPAQCDAKLLADLVVANDTVTRCISGPLTHNQRSALVSFTFNVGPGGAGVKDGLCVLKSGKVPSIRRYFNTGYPVAGCNELLKWANPPLRGIIKRRDAERALCLKA